MKTIFKYKFWLVVVLIIHVIASLNLDSKNDGSAGHSGKKSVTESSLDKKDKKSISDILDEDFKSFIAKQKQGTSGKIKVKLIGKTSDFVENQGGKENKCDQGSYEGIGVSHSWFMEYVITDLAKGYAAEKAGLKKGDVVVGFFEHSDPSKFIEGASIRGKAGTGIDLFVKRNDKIIKFSIIREKICYEKNKP